MSWLGQGFDRESMKSLADAYAQIDENRRAARAAGGYVDDGKKQPDPSKPGFTGTGNASIKDIMKMNKEIEKKNKMKKEEYVDEGMKTNIPGAKIGGSIKKPNGKTMKVEEVIVDSYSVSVEDGIALEEGKKKCKDGYEYDSDEKKCVKKKKSSRTTVIIGRGYGYGPGHDHDDDKDDDGNGGDGGGDAGGGDGGGGGE